MLGIKLLDGRSGAPRVSGDLPSHYAPHTPVRLLGAAELNETLQKASIETRIGVIALGVEVAAGAAQTEWRTLSAAPLVYARQFYASLRELDERRLDLILLEVPPDTIMCEAVCDRLRRTAGSH